MKIQKGKILFFALSAFLFSFLLVLALYRVNAASPRISVQELETLSSCPENGPVLLTGGEMGTDDEGNACYTLSFAYPGKGTVYFPRAGMVSVNGSSDRVETALRGSFSTLAAEEDNDRYTIVIRDAGSAFSAPGTCVYLGTAGQISGFITASAGYNTWIQGMCFTITLFSLVLFFFKPGESYLLWLALLSLFRADYFLLRSLLALVTWVPFLGFLAHSTVYLVLLELLTAVLQYKLMQTFMPVRLGRIPFPWYAAIAALPVLLLNRTAFWRDVSGLCFFVVLYLCYLLCFLRLPARAYFERAALFVAWTLTVSLRFFDEFCELGWFPSGDVNLRFRLRGLVSMLLVTAFFVIVGKRFAQKFREADELNVYLEDRIKENTRRQTLFVRSMLHNLKTPLFSLSGYSDMALRSIDNQPAQARTYMEKAREKAIFAGELIDHLFLVTQMEADMVQMQFAPVNLRHLLEAVADTPTAGQENKTVQIHLDAPEEVYLQADQLYLRQAIQNIVDNARILTPEGGSIFLSARREEQGVRIDIRDTGPGIPEEEQEKIFDAYYSNRHGKKQSSGLGLYIASEIVKRHQGKIRVESTVGEGADFILWLPYAEQEE